MLILCIIFCLTCVTWPVLAVNIADVEGLEDYIDMIKSNNERIQDLENKLEDKKSFAATIPAFNVRLAENTDVDSSPIVFQSVLLNVGNGYSDTSGVFIPPRNGTYLLSAYSLSIGDRSDLFIKNDDTILCASHASGDEFHAAACMAVAQLTTADEVYACGSDGDNPISGTSSGFTGFLIEETE